MEVEQVFGDVVELVLFVVLKGVDGLECFSFVLQCAAAVALWVGRFCVDGIWVLCENVML